jgi:predicted HTH domain antitoxin
VIPLYPVLYKTAVTRMHRSMTASATLELPADLLHTTRMSAGEMRVELAISLFARQRLSLGKAAEYAELPVAQFQALLAARKIGPHYDEADALRDATTLADLHASS